MSVGSIIGEPITIHKLASGKDKKEKVQNLLQTVGLNPIRHRFPHEFSGANASASASPAPSPSNPISSSATSRFRPWTSRSRRQIINLLQDLQDSSTSPTFHRPRPFGGAPYQRPRGSHVPRPHHGADRPGLDLREPLHPTRRRSCQRFRSRTRRSNASASASSCWRCAEPAPASAGCVFHTVADRHRRVPFRRPEWRNVGQRIANTGSGAPGVAGPTLIERAPLGASFPFSRLRRSGHGGACRCPRDGDGLALQTATVRRS